MQAVFYSREVDFISKEAVFSLSCFLPWWSVAESGPCHRESCWSPWVTIVVLVRSRLHSPWVKVAGSFTGCRELRATDGVSGEREWRGAAAELDWGQRVVSGVQSGMSGTPEEKASGRTTRRALSGHSIAGTQGHCSSPCGSRPQPGGWAGRNPN